MPGSEPSPVVLAAALRGYRPVGLSGEQHERIIRSVYPLICEDVTAEVERLREALREFAKRIERDRREPDKVLIEATSMRAVADDVRAFPNAS